ncbi:YlmH/Sll1252 family protein [Streptococcus sp. X16XC17]|uniref:YlmH family RNA-binding protein n=1 Tax=Streptococcus sp. X16XC17 TaxID=2316646 RepID=UPI001F0F4C61|nr:YlmH/Sll1252 family protein [Streptococcus sp. X16XC17]
MQHFAKEEHEFADKIVDMCQQVEDTYSYRLTHFINPMQEEIVHSIAAYFQLSSYSSRQFLDTEFVRVIIAPDYYELDKKDFEMALLEIDYPRKFHQLRHSQILGTLLNQLGIQRQFLDDILFQDENIFVLMDGKFAHLAETGLVKIARVPVKWKEREWSNLKLNVAEKGKNREILLSSLRLDKIVATVFRQSRSTASSLIEAGKVKVDYREIVQVGKQIEIGQLISVRGFGRIRLKELAGYSKQGKLKVEIEVIGK